MLDSRPLRPTRSVAHRMLLSCLALAALGLPAHSALALSLQVSAAAPAPLATGDSVTLTVSLDQATAFNGYELFLSWDPTELQFSSAQQLFVSPFVPFSAKTIDPVESRLSTLVPSDPSSVPVGQDLFSVDFSVLNLVDDGQVDFRVFAKGSGTSTGLAGTPPPVLDNPQGVEVLAGPGGLTVVPEPSSAVLLALALVATTSLRRRRSG